MEQEDQNTNGGQKNGGSGASRFPKVPLMQALKVSEAIETANAGKPYPPIDTANALGISPGSSNFRTLLAGSYQYGLTEGSYKSPRIALRPAAQSINAPRTPDDRSDALVAAALTPEAFAWMFDHYKGKRLPEIEYIVNTVARELSLERSKAEKCAQVFIENARFVGLVRDTKSGEWLSAEAETASGIDVTRVEEEPDASSDEDLAAETPRDDVPTAASEPRSNAIFVGARKGKARDQLTKTLDGLGIPYKVAEEEPNLARPISHKVKQTMEACGAAILVFTADEEFREKDSDDSVWKPSENVVHELGASSMLYDDRIVVFKEEGVRLASNFSGIGYIEFEKDKLDAKVNDLLRELFAFKIIAVQVGG